MFTNFYRVGAVVLLLNAPFANAQNTPAPLTFESSREGHVFPDSRGEVTLKIADGTVVTGGEVRLSDETGVAISTVKIPAKAQRVTIPLERKGYFALQARVTTPQGDLTSTTWASVIGALPPDSERLASSLGLAKIQGSNALMDASGSGWIRGFTPQNGIVRGQNGTIDWWPAYNRSAPKDNFNRIEAVMSPPAFTVAPEHQAKQSITVTYPPADWEAYRKVARLFATSRPWVQYFEGINEPDANHWRGTDEELVKYHRVMREEVHAAGANQKVLGPCFWSIDLPHLDKLVKLGFLDSVDGISMHSYANAPPEGKWIDDIRNLKAYLVRQGRPNMPVFLTEYGWGTGNGDKPSPEQELVQARYVARGMTLLAAENLAASQYFVLRYAAPHDDGWSITRADNTPRPAYTAVSQIFRWLGNAKGTTQFQPTPTSYLVLFAKGNRTVAVGWDTQGTSRITLPLRPLRMESMTGAPIRLDAPSVELSPSPVFMEFDSPSLATPVVGREAIDITRGKTLALAGASGQLALPLPLSVAGKTVSAPADALPGRYNGLQLVDKQWRVFPVQINAPWKIENVRVEWPAGSPTAQVLFTARNDAERVTLLPYLQLNGLPDEFGEPVTLETGQSRTIALGIKNYVYGTPIRGLARLEQRTDKGISSLTLPFDSLPIIAPQRAVGANDLPKLRSTAWRVFGLGDPKELAPEDCSATLQSSTEAAGLRLKVDVRDDVYFPGQLSAPLWACDSVQFAFDLKSLGTKDDTIHSKQTLEYVVGYRNDKPLAFRFISTVPSLAQNVEEPDIQAKVVRQGDVTHYDILLPWKTLGLTGRPATGQGIGFNLAINDSDGRPADRHGFEITSGIVSNKDTSAFATLLFQ